MVTRFRYHQGLLQHFLPLFLIVIPFNASMTWNGKARVAWLTASKSPAVSHLYGSHLYSTGGYVTLSHFPFLNREMIQYQSVGSLHPQDASPRAHCSSLPTVRFETSQLLADIVYIVMDTVDARSSPASHVRIKVSTYSQFLEQRSQKIEAPLFSRLPRRSND